MCVRGGGTWVAACKLPCTMCGLSEPAPAPAFIVMSKARSRSASVASVGTKRNSRIWSRVGLAKIARSIAILVNAGKKGKNKLQKRQKNVWAKRDVFTIELMLEPPTFGSGVRCTAVVLLTWTPIGKNRNSGSFPLGEERGLVPPACQNGTQILFFFQR